MAATRDLAGYPDAIETAVENAKPREGELFDGNAYNDPRLELATRDGRRITDLRVGFSGGIELERHGPDDVDWWKSLRVGDEVTLRVEATVVGEQQAHRSTEQETSLIGKKQLRIHSVVEMQ